MNTRKSPDTTISPASPNAKCVPSKSPYTMTAKTAASGLASARIHLGQRTNGLPGVNHHGTPFSPRPKTSLASLANTIAGCSASVAGPSGLRFNQTSNRFRAANGMPATRSNIAYRDPSNTSSSRKNKKAGYSARSKPAKWSGCSRNAPMPTNAANNEPNNHQAIVTATLPNLQSGAPVIPCVARNPPVAQALSLSAALCPPAREGDDLPNAFRQIAYAAYGFSAKTLLLVIK